MTIRTATAAYKGAQQVYHREGIINSPGNVTHGQRAAVTVWQERASLGYKSDYQAIVRYTWEVRFPDNPKGSYRRKTSGKNAEKDIAEAIAAADELIQPPA